MLKAIEEEFLGPGQIFSSFVFVIPVVMFEIIIKKCKNIKTSSNLLTILVNQSNFLLRAARKAIKHGQELSVA